MTRWSFVSGPGGTDVRPVRSAKSVLALLELVDANNEKSAQLAHELSAAMRTHVVNLRGAAPPTPPVRLDAPETTVVARVVEIETEEASPPPATKAAKKATQPVSKKPPKRKKKPDDDDDDDDDD